VHQIQCECSVLSESQAFLTSINSVYTVPLYSCIFPTTDECKILDLMNPINFVYVRIYPWKKYIGQYLHEFDDSDVPLYAIFSIILATSSLSLSLCLLYANKCLCTSLPSNLNLSAESLNVVAYLNSSLFGCYVNLCNKDTRVRLENAASKPGTLTGVSTTRGPGSRHIATTVWRTRNMYTWLALYRSIVQAPDDKRGYRWGWSIGGMITGRCKPKYWDDMCMW
jgi:hypothetical protein